MVGKEDPSPLGHILQLSWSHPLRGAHDPLESLPDAPPPPLGGDLPATAWVAYALDPAVCAAADVQRLNVARFDKDEIWKHVGPLMGAPPSPHECGGQWDLVSVVLWDRGHVREAQNRPWVEPAEDYPRLAYILWPNGCRNTGACCRRFGPRLIRGQRHG